MRVKSMKSANANRDIGGRGTNDTGRVMTECRGTNDTGRVITERCGAVRVGVTDNVSVGREMAGKIVGKALNISIIIMYISLFVGQLVGIILATLRLTGIIDWRWGVVMMPFILTAISVASVVLIYIACNAINNKTPNA